MPICFKTLDSAKTANTLKLKEAIFIKNKNAQLNTQVQHNDTFLCS